MTDTLDSFAIRTTDSNLDIHFSYTVRFSIVHVKASPPISVTYTYADVGSGEGGKADCAGGLVCGLRVSIGGRDASYFDVCYQLHLRTGVTSRVYTNGEWADESHVWVDGVKVYVRMK